MAEVQLDSRGKRRVQTSYEGFPSLTVQSEANNADIKHILKQYAEVGIVEGLNQAELAFADITEFTDFADAMRHAKMAEQDFMKLPSRVRAIFEHDVGVWLDTAHDEDKRDALVAAGIIEGPREVVEPAGPPAVVQDGPKEPPKGEPGERVEPVVPVKEA